jgi:hypothetical protein
MDDELPATMAGRHPAPAERIVLQGDAENPLADVKVLLLGARRADELTGETRAVFLGQHNEILNPAWMSWCVREFRDRPVRDLAVRLVNDMLAQANRVALEKLSPTPAAGFRCTRASSSGTAGITRQVTKAMAR